MIQMRYYTSSEIMPISTAPTTVEYCDKRQRIQFVHVIICLHLFTCFDDIAIRRPLRQIEQRDVEEACHEGPS